MDVKGKVLLQLFNKSKLTNGTKTFLEPKFFSKVKFKNLVFSALLSSFARLFAKLSRPEDIKVTFSVFESSIHLLLSV